MQTPPIDQDELRAQIFERAGKKIKDTSKVTYEFALDTMHDYQEQILNEPKTPVILVENPFEAWYVANLALAGYPVNTLKSQMEKDLSERSDLIVTTIPKYDGSGDFIVDDAFFPFHTGSMDSYDLTFFEFAEKYWNVQFDAETKRNWAIIENVQKLGGFFPLKNVCVVSQKPAYVQYNENNQLHNSNGPAYGYDGFFPYARYFLNGVEVPEWLACEKSTDIDIQRYNEVTNADVRSEFVRKVGIERMLETGKKIDSYEKYDDKMWKKSQYELWDMAHLFTNVQFAPHLKMLNQTTGIWHVEAVSPDCTNLQKAIAFRLGDRKLRITAIA
jgi:hypothetical protein